MSKPLQKIIISDHSVSIANEAKSRLINPPIHPDFNVLLYDGQSALDFHTGNDHFALLLNLKGSGTASLGNFCFKLETHSLYLLKPTTLPIFQELSKDFQSYLVLFKKDFLMNALVHEPLIENLMGADFDEPAACILDKASFLTIYNLFKRLDQEYHTNKLFHDKMLKLLFIELLFEASRTSAYVPIRPLALPSRQQQLVNKFKKLIEEHFLTKRTVQEYADGLFVTAKYLSEVVKAYTGVTALHLIHDRLFQEAKYWLSVPGLSVKEIAGKLNFDTSSHFSRFFKHVAGYNPTEFQRVYLRA